MEQQLCGICKENIDCEKPCSRLTQKGSNSISIASKKRNDNLVVLPGQYVHVECRKQYCNPNVILRDAKNQGKSNDSRLTRSRYDTFSFSKQCMFCGQPAKLDGRKHGHDVFAVRTIEFQKKIIDICKLRNDPWAEVIHARLQVASDLPAVDAVYHQICSINFRTFKDIPMMHNSEQTKKCKFSQGRPVNNEAETAFINSIEYLKQNEEEQITVLDLVNRMKEVCGEKSYGVQYTKQKLQEYFGDSVIITEMNGKQNVVTLRKTAKSILHEFYFENKCKSSEEEKVKLLKAAAQIIQSEIKSVYSDKSVYPSPTEISSIESNTQFIPGSLVQFLCEIFSLNSSNIKVCSIGQAIMQTARPRLIMAPLQFGLGIQLHHQFASKYLIGILNSMGFCISYSEVQMFQSNAAVSNRTDIDNFKDDMFIQYAADNVDHNLRTLDGHDTFHGMGMIAAVTPGSFSFKTISSTVVSADELLSAGKIEISFYHQTEASKPCINLSELSEIGSSENTKKVSFLCQVTWPLRNPGPDWSGLMQMVSKGTYPGKSSFVYLPMIDMNPGDMSCIYSTLKYISNHAHRYQQTAVITFDQPLYWKAMTIVSCENDRNTLSGAIIRLGGFHCVMSYLGCIGQLMSG